jgi:hypothetical protein
VTGHRVGNLVQAREIAHPLIALQPYHQHEEGLVSGRLPSRPADLVHRGCERLDQLPRRDGSAEPRVGGAVDRCQHTPRRSRGPG